MHQYEQDAIINPPITMDKLGPLFTFAILIGLQGMAVNDIVIGRPYSVYLNQASKQCNAMQSNDDRSNH